MHNLPGSEPAQPQGFQGQGAWLLCLPRAPPQPSMIVFLAGDCNNASDARLQEQGANARGQAVALI